MMNKTGDYIYWIDIDKIKPNPYQPRKVFDETKLLGLADSIRQYGVLQPLVVTKKERITDDGGMVSEYELIAGERRLRASQIANLRQVPVIIRTHEDSGRVKLELAIIENLQREDLTPIDRAKAFKELAEKFSLKHSDIATKVGKSREYISNSIRLLLLPEEITSAIESGFLSEGHARPILMLQDRPEDQKNLFDEIIVRKLTVRDAESIARGIASDKVRKKSKVLSPEIEEAKKIISERLGTRVHIEAKEEGGKIMIDFFSDADLPVILKKLITESEDQQNDDDLYEQTSTEDNNEDDMYSFKNFSL